MPKAKKLKLNIPKGAVLCPKCQGVGCKECWMKGYYFPDLEKPKVINYSPTERDA